jgi:hypothetical protein
MHNGIANTQSSQRINWAFYRLEIKTFSWSKLVFTVNGNMVTKVCLFPINLSFTAEDLQATQKKLESL